MKNLQNLTDKWDDEDRQLIIHKGKIRKVIKKEPFKREKNKRKWLDEDDE